MTDKIVALINSLKVDEKLKKQLQNHFSRMYPSIGSERNYLSEESESKIISILQPVAALLEQQQEELVNKILEEKLLSLDSLPSEIKSTIASYLPFKDTDQFIRSTSSFYNDELLREVLKKNHQISAGEDTTLILDSYHRLWGWGMNSFGQLGTGDNDNMHELKQIILPEDFGIIRQVFAEYHRTFIVNKFGEVWGSGNNYHGQLGLGHSENVNKFTQIKSLANIGKIEQVVSGVHYTVILNTEGILWWCGSYYPGHIEPKDLEYPQGINEFNRVNLPVDAGKIIQVASGTHHTNDLLLNEAGELWGYGENICGNEWNRESNNNFNRIMLPPEAGKIVKIASGIYHSLVLNERGELWGSGENELGQLGILNNEEFVDNFTHITLPAGIGRIVQVFAGEWHSLVLNERGELWGCGSNEEGQLGPGHDKNVHQFRHINLPRDFGRVKQVSTKKNHTIVESKEGEIWACGLMDEKSPQRRQRNRMKHNEEGFKIPTDSRTKKWKLPSRSTQSINDKLSIFSTESQAYKEPHNSDDKDTKPGHKN